MVGDTAPPCFPRGGWHIFAEARSTEVRREGGLPFLLVPIAATLVRVMMLHPGVCPFLAASDIIAADAPKCRGERWKGWPLGHSVAGREAGTSPPPVPPSSTPSTCSALSTAPAAMASVRSQRLQEPCMAGSWDGSMGLGCGLDGFQLEATVPKVAQSPGIKARVVPICTDSDSGE